MRVALIGFGHEARSVYWPVLHENRDLQGAVSDPALTTNAATLEAEKLGVRVFAAPLTLFHEFQPGMAIISATPSAHYGLLSQAVECGVPAVCDKPLLISPQELQTLEKQFRRRSVELRFVNNWEYSQQFSMFKAEVARIRWDPNQTVHLTFEFQRPLPSDVAGWRFSPTCGGVAWEYGWHAIYLARKMLSSFRADNAAFPARPSRVRIRHRDLFHSEFSFSYAAMDVMVRAVRGDLPRRTLLICAQDDRTVALLDDKLTRMSQGKKAILEIAAPPLPNPESRTHWFRAMTAEGLLKQEAAEASRAEARDCLRVLQDVYPI